MCLAVPGEILSIDQSTATVDLGGVRQDVRLDLVDNASVGSYVLVHVGYAIQLMTPAEAKETFALFDEYAAALELEGVPGDGR
jgi:hydrogenase expression/formation protein HypC